MPCTGGGLGDRTSICGDLSCIGQNVQRQHRTGHPVLGLSSFEMPSDWGTQTNSATRLVGRNPIKMDEEEPSVGTRSAHPIARL